MKFDNTFINLPKEFFAAAAPAKFSAPQLLKFNDQLAAQLGLDLTAFSQSELANIFVGQMMLTGSTPIAMAYAGHQFGHFVPQLGDGRAMLLGEVVDPQGRRFDIQLKGAGQTVFSRNGDGRSALGPVMREYIISEAMFHLGVPTTRALAATITGDLVYRETPLPGAILTRVAAGHIRIGTFQYLAAKGDIAGLKTLLDYSIKRHYPEIMGQANSARLFLKKVAAAQASLIAQWMGLGFIHGVMNTDNMTISGETIDYGPCAFMDNFNFNQVFSFIDRNGRYAYANQKDIAMWNLSRLADSLIPLVHADQNTAMASLNEELSTLPELFNKAWGQQMAAKLGLLTYQKNDEQLIQKWLNYLQSEQLDFTLSFRLLANRLEGHEDIASFKATEKFDDFLTLWKLRLKIQGKDISSTKNQMNSINPIYIPRNHQVERAIQSALDGDYSIFHELIQVLKQPFQRQREFANYQSPPLPEERVAETFCGT